MTSGLDALLFALEGVFCIAMAAPLGIAFAAIGAALGSARATRITPPDAVVGLVPHQ